MENKMDKEIKELINFIKCLSNYVDLEYIIDDNITYEGITENPEIVAIHNINIKITAKEINKEIDSKQLELDYSKFIGNINQI
jgi:hypothetical protein